MGQVSYDLSCPTISVISAREIELVSTGVGRPMPLESNIDESSTPVLFGRTVVDDAASFEWPLRLPPSASDFLVQSLRRVMESTRHRLWWLFPLPVDKGAVITESEEGIITLWGTWERAPEVEGIVVEPPLLNVFNSSRSWLAKKRVRMGKTVSSGESSSRI